MARCLDFADAVAKANLTSTPSEAVARDVANSLDSRLSRLGSPAVHDPAVKLHQDLHAVEVARRRNEPADADRAASRAREDIDRLAAACDVPSSRFLEPATSSPDAG